MLDKDKYTDINNKLNFLLRDHGVKFKESNEGIEDIKLFHEKADTLLVAHNLDIPKVEQDIAGLQPKLNMLIRGHGASFDDSTLDLDSLDTVLIKLNVLELEHGA